jgi:hypothetical protein
MTLTKRDWALIASAAIVLLFVNLVAGMFVDDIVVISSIASTVLLFVVILALYRRIRSEQEALQRSLEHKQDINYRQLESLFSLFFTLQPRAPFPDMRDWAASPDLLKKIMEVMFKETPRLVVEASSGVSTIVIAYCLKQLGNGGRVLSLEHDAKYAAISQQLVAAHGLSDVATVVHAPLTDVEVNGQKWLWYNSAGISLDQPIDLLVIDGPPGSLQKLSRYPALPLLHGKMSHRSTIILDDGDREDEKTIASRWEREFTHLSSEYVPLEKGAFVLRLNNPGA